MCPVWSGKSYSQSGRALVVLCNFGISGSNFLYPKLDVYAPLDEKFAFIFKIRLRLKLHKCLYLFVSVMVWIHGGGFVRGNGGTDFYGPDFFMSSENPVILVTLNYRLGILGFLSLG